MNYYSLLIFKEVAMEFMNLLEIILLDSYCHNLDTRLRLCYFSIDLISLINADYSGILFLSVNFYQDLIPYLLILNLI